MESVIIARTIIARSSWSLEISNEDSKPSNAMLRRSPVEKFPIYRCVDGVMHVISLSNRSRC